MLIHHGLDERPQFEISWNEIFGPFGYSWLCGLDRFLYELIEAFAVSDDDLKHLGDKPWIADTLFEDVRRDFDCIERSLEIVHDEGEIFLTPLRCFDILFMLECLDRDCDGPVEREMKYVPSLATDNDGVCFGAIEDHLAQNAVFLYNFHDVESELKPLLAVATGGLTQFGIRINSLHP